MKIERLNIVGAPYSYGCKIVGVEKGPETISKLLQGQSVCLFPKNDEKKCNNIQSAIRYCMRLRDLNESFLKQGKRVLTIGGDHTIALGTVAASLCLDENVGLIWIDAHTDINTEQTTITGNLHGMPVAALLGLCESDLNMVASVHIKPQNIVYIGSRSIDIGEKDIIKRLGISVYTIEDVRNLGYEKIIAQINEKFSKLRVNNIHISFDLDVMDPSVVDAVSVPESNGLTTSEYCELTDELHLLRGVVCAMDIVEYNVALDKYNFTYSWLADNIPYIIALLNENERGKNYSG